MQYQGFPYALVGSISLIFYSEVSCDPVGCFQPAHASMGSLGPTVKVITHVGDLHKSGNILGNPVNRTPKI
jgi:hypothetical protein